MIVVSLPASPLPLWHLFIWSITGAITVSYSLNVRPVWVIFPFWSQKKKKKKKKRISLSHSAAFRLRGGCFFVVFGNSPAAIKKLISGGRLSRHISSVSWCMSAHRVKRTLSRSDWNWNHFIMRHYGKCRASELGGGGNKYCHASQAPSVYSPACMCYF